MNTVLLTALLGVTAVFLVAGRADAHQTRPGAIFDIDRLPRATAVLHSVSNPGRRVHLAMFIPKEGESQAIVRISGVTDHQKFHIESGLYETCGTEHGQPGLMARLTTVPIHGNNRDIHTRLSVTSLERLDGTPVTLMVLGGEAGELPYACGTFRNIVPYNLV